MFETSFKKILQRVEQIDPIAYGRSRNFLNGAVTKLSPYISRGVISTRFVMNSLVNRGFKPVEILKLIQELAWRDYFQQVWKARGDEIHQDIKNTQSGVKHHQMPCVVLNSQTGIQAIDLGIKDLYNKGYMHNHLRMYVASIACNVGGSHWKTPAKWLYYHLLDGDLASNTLSWQWVSGAFSSKKYYANQDNINKYCNTDQKGTFLDVGYEEFDSMQIPDELLETCIPELKTNLPEPAEIKIDILKPTLIYNSCNLDPDWKKQEEVNRVLLLEPSHFEKYPVSDKTISFILSLAENIDGIQVFTGEFKDLVNRYELKEVFFKEHPANKHYKGTWENRDWMFDVQGYYPSFFIFWKQCEKQLVI